MGKHVGSTSVSGFKRNSQIPSKQSNLVANKVSVPMGINPNSKLYDYDFTPHNNQAGRTDSGLTSIGSMSGSR